MGLPRTSDPPVDGAIPFLDELLRALSPTARAELRWTRPEFLRIVRRLRDEPFSADLCDEVVAQAAQLYVKVALLVVPHVEGARRFMDLGAQVIDEVGKDLGPRLPSAVARDTLRWCSRGMAALAAVATRGSGGGSSAELRISLQDVPADVRTVDWCVLVLLAATLANDGCDAERLGQIVDEAFLRLCDRAPLLAAAGVDALGTSRSAVERARDLDSAVGGLRATLTPDAVAAIADSRLTTLR